MKIEEIVYQSPEIEVVEIIVEQGFGASSLDYDREQW